MLNEQIGQYRITGRLGQGGMGEIFSALDEKLNRTVAVKFIAQARVEGDLSKRLFLREARAAAALDHPFICTVHDVLEYNGQPVIVMERVEGETLQALISRGALAPDQIVRIAKEIAEALAAAHERGIVHRDIKPANIMLTPSGHVKVMDFGLAVIVTASPDEQTAHQSQELRFAGTTPYMAPEVLRGGKATRASDVYALGVVMYEMATGKRPFSGKTDAMLISEILEKQPSSAGLPRSLEKLILRLVSKDPARRPEIGGVITALTGARRKRSAPSPFSRSNRSPATPRMPTSAWRLPMPQPASWRWCTHCSSGRPAPFFVIRLRPIQSAQRASSASMLWLRERSSAPDRDCA